MRIKSKAMARQEALSKTKATNDQVIVDHHILNQPHNVDTPKTENTASTSDIAAIAVSSGTAAVSTGAAIVVAGGTGATAAMQNAKLIGAAAAASFLRNVAKRGNIRTVGPEVLEEIRTAPLQSVMGIGPDVPRPDLTVSDIVPVEFTESWVGRTLGVGEGGRLDATIVPGRMDPSALTQFQRATLRSFTNTVSHASESIDMSNATNYGRALLSRVTGTDFGQVDEDGDVFYDDPDGYVLEDDEDVFEDAIGDTELDDYVDKTNSITDPWEESNPYDPIVNPEGASAAELAAAEASTAKALKIASRLNKGLGAAGLALAAGQSGYESYQTEQDLKKGVISEQQAQKEQGKNWGGFAGGLLGGMAGTAAVVASGGTALPLVIGAGLVGGLLGQIGGSAGGEAIGEALPGKHMSRLQEEAELRSKAESEFQRGHYFNTRVNISRMPRRNWHDHKDIVIDWDDYLGHHTYTTQTDLTSDQFDAIFNLPRTNRRVAEFGMEEYLHNLDRYNAEAESHRVRTSLGTVSVRPGARPYAGLDLPIGI